MSSVAPPLTGDDTSPGTPDRWYLLSYVALNYFAIYAHRNLINYIQPSLLLPITEGGLGLDEAQLSWVGPAFAGGSVVLRYEVRQSGGVGLA